MTAQPDAEDSTTGGARDWVASVVLGVGSVIAAPTVMTLGFILVDYYGTLILCVAVAVVIAMRVRRRRWLALTWLGGCGLWLPVLIWLKSLSELPADF